MFLLIDNASLVSHQGSALTSQQHRLLKEANASVPPGSCNQWSPSGIFLPLDIEPQVVTQCQDQLQPDHHQTAQQPPSSQPSASPPPKGLSGIPTRTVPPAPCHQQAAPPAQPPGPLADATNRKSPRHPRGRPPAAGEKTLPSNSSLAKLFGVAVAAMQEYYRVRVSVAPGRDDLETKVVLFILHVFFYYLGFSIVSSLESNHLTGASIRLDVVGKVGNRASSQPHCF